MASSTPASAMVDQATVRQRPSRPWLDTLMFVVRKAPFALITLGILVGLIVAAPILGLPDPLAINKGEQFSPPSLTYPFGTDEFGRDIFSRVIYAGRTSLMASLVAVTLATLIGVPLGLLAAYVGGILDTLIMRSMDVLLAFPAVLLAMAIVAVLGPGFTSALIAVAIVSVPAFARLTRAAALAQKEREYVQAAQTIGAHPWYIVFRTLLPNCVPPIIVQMAVTIAFAILLEASLGFLGLGSQPPTPSWGSMLQTARVHLRRAWWYGTFPGAFVTIFVLAVNSIADTLRDALDPKTRKI